jgi:hypothetical protein
MMVTFRITVFELDDLDVELELELELLVLLVELELEVFFTTVLEELDEEPPLVFFTVFVLVTVLLEDDDPRFSRGMAKAAATRHTTNRTKVSFILSMGNRAAICCTNWERNY